MKCKYMIEKITHPTSSSCVVRMFCKIKKVFCCGRCKDFKEIKDKKGSRF